MAICVSYDLPAAQEKVFIFLHSHKTITILKVKRKDGNPGAGLTKTLRPEWSC